MQVSLLPTHPISIFHTVFYSSLFLYYYSAYFPPMATEQGAHSWFVYLCGLRDASWMLYPEAQSFTFWPHLNSTGAFLTTTSICLRVTLSIELLICYLNRPQCHDNITVNSIFVDEHGFRGVVTLRWCGARRWHQISPFPWFPLLG